MVTGSSEAELGPKAMRLRYAGKCRACGAALPAGVTAVYDRSAKQVSCVDCPPTLVEAAPGEAAPPPTPPPARPDVDTGAAGSSARREYQRRSAARETRIRESHPHLGGLILAVSKEPQTTTAWARGAKGEELLGQRLDTLVQRGVRTLHDRRIPRTKANIDHIAVTPSGVFVIDAKRYAGRPTLRVEGGLLRPRTTRLMVGSRDCTKLVDGVHKQVALVADALAAAGHGDIAVRGVLCFIEADWPLFGGAFEIDGVDVTWPKRLAARLVEEGSMDPQRIDEIHHVLATAFPTA